MGPPLLEEHAVQLLERPELGDLPLVGVHGGRAGLLDQLRDEALTEPALRERVDLLASLVESPASGLVRYPPTLVTRYATRVGELAFLSMFTTFGTPHSVTLASLRAELRFIIFTATGRARSLSCASTTRPMPPVAISRSRRYLMKAPLSGSGQTMP